MIDPFEIRHQMNEEAEELLNLRARVDELEEENAALADRNDRQAITIAEYQEDLSEANTRIVELDEALYEYEQADDAYELRERVAHLEDALESADALIDNLQNQVTHDWATGVVVLDAISDLRALSEVPMNLVEPAIENIIDDLRKVLGI